MKTSEFKLLSMLPEEYDYEILYLNDKKAVIGTNHSKIIGFFIIDDKLFPINFLEAPAAKRELENNNEPDTDRPQHYMPLDLYRKYNV